jgi:hypothetical protein
MTLPSVIVSFQNCLIILRSNLIQEEIKRRLNSGNACCHSVQNLLSSRLLTVNINIRLYKTIIFQWFCVDMKHGL